MTSHTTKALRVLREQVVEPLRPLCMSVLEGDVEGRRDLEASVHAIIERLSTSDMDELDRAADSLAQRREHLIRKLEEERGDLAKARADEYRDIVVAGVGYPPSDAARRVACGIGRDDWVPLGVTAGDPLPLDPVELAEFYRTAKAVTVADESELRLPLPDPGKLLRPDDFDKVAEQRALLVDVDRITGSEFWETKPGIEGATRLEGLSSRLAQAMGKVDASQPWQLDAIAAGRLGGPHREPRDDLLAMIANACALAAAAVIHLMRHDPGLPAASVAPRAEADRRRDPAAPRRRGQARVVRPPDKAHMEDLDRWRERRGATPSPPRTLPCAGRPDRPDPLPQRSDRAVGPSDGRPRRPGSDQLSPGQPEASCHQFTSQIRACLGWHASDWRPIEAELREMGFRWEEFLAETPPNLATHGELLRLRDAVQDRLPKVLTARANAIRRQEMDSYLSNLAHVLASVGGDKPAQVVESLRQSVKAADPVAYREHYRRLVELNDLRNDLTLRDKLFTRLRWKAPAWATAIRDRHAPHNGGSVPGDAQAAWLWRQLHEELERRGQKSLQEMQRTIERLDEELRCVTAGLIDHRAWAAQVRRVTPSQRRAELAGSRPFKRSGREWANSPPNSASRRPASWPSAAEPYPFGSCRCPASWRTSTPGPHGSTS